MIDLFDVYGKEIAKKRIKNPIYKPFYIGVSRFGVCPKQTMLMFTDAKRKEKSVEEIMQEEAMFRMAKKLEQDYANLFLKKGLLFSYNSWVGEGLPYGFTGQFDFLLRKNKKWALIEFKASHPNIMNYTDTLPKFHHILQAEGYVYALDKMGIKCDNYCVMYVSRGGEGKPAECWRKINWIKLVERIETEMNSLKKHKKILDEALRLTIPNQSVDLSTKLPPILERIVVLRKGKKGLEARLEPSWECGYCDFDGTACNPETSKNKIADILQTVDKDKTIIKMRKGYEEFKKDVENFISKQTLGGEENV